jgi:hypothetical protein
VIELIKSGQQAGTVLDKFFRLMNAQNFKYPIPFAKMSGTGNDFIIIDHREPFIAEADQSEFARIVCRRKFSVGADGLILIENSETADFRWQFYNCAVMGQDVLPGLPLRIILLRQPCGSRPQQVRLRPLFWTGQVSQLRYV